jgi:hypothetical protein
MKGARFLLHILFVAVWFLAANHCYIEDAFGSEACTSSHRRTGESHEHGERCTISVAVPAPASQSLARLSGQVLLSAGMLASHTAVFSILGTAKQALPQSALGLFQYVSRRAALALKLSPNAPPPL